MRQVKISLIGAGSRCFSIGLIQDLCQKPTLSGATVSIMDTDEVRLKTVETLCRRFAAEKDADLTIEATTDRRASLKGADFVVNTACPGAHHRTDQALSPKAVDLYKTFGVVPIGDTSHWTGANWPFWYHSDEEVMKRWSEVEAYPYWRGYADGSPATAQQMKEISEDLSVQVSEVYAGESNESFVSLIESMACDIPRVFQGNNILNVGAFVPGIAADVAVEVPTQVSARGVQGIRTGGLPRGVLAWLLRDRIAPMELELEAYNAGSRELLLQLILMDKGTTSRAQATAMLDEILALPYHKDMKAHYV